MALGHVDALAYISAKIMADDEERKKRAAAAEKRVASYYLKEKYSDSESSSNREELQYVLSCLKYTVKDYRDEECEEDWKVVSNCDLKPRVEDIKVLVKRAISNHYSAVKDNVDDANIYANCLHLFSKDYKCEIIENPGGALSWNYPVNIIVPMGLPENPNQLDSYSWEPEVFRDGKFQEYKEMLSQAPIARCRNRFPVPVILCGEKYICRSGTLAVRKSAAYEALTQTREPESKEVPEGALSQFWDGVKTVAKRSKASIVNFYNALDMLLNVEMDDIKELDVRVLELLSIEFICDLMVENRKIHTGLSVGSSEKINLRKYGKFKILKIPYPGCGFFARYSEAGRNGKNLVYDWDMPEVDASLGMAADEEENFKLIEDVNWQLYVNWDLLELTKNYMKLLLSYATDNRSDGLLVHCISGWDRTPLFICLLRLSLWADGFIHTSLDAVEMAYLTLGYDWYLFGHDLPARLKNSEEILHFCFNFIPELASQEYCMRKGSAKDKHNLVKRRDLLCEVSSLVLKFYEDRIRMERGTPDRAVSRK
ncbi:phosphatidylinositol-3,5-bisphosphate 3-phosphatase MTMR14 [Parasteatoda tepidariorum]|uniref:phosphatidylinositol-3,5-bisphosphate 3-phosphatase MTMR14 n=1 Tax=Parasteatoda tepidariorum TaxID=114398 RepID=UPI001C723A1C|nr:myotubularin-related protein 14 [Parasteatoda tepidariorum]